MRRSIKNNPVFINIKNFIEDKQKTALMEKCYSAIRGKQGRKFDYSIPVLENDQFDALLPLVSMVILTANKFECDALNYLVFTKNNDAVHKRKSKVQIFENSDRHSPSAYILKISSSYVLHLLANETGSNTPGGSSDLVRYISKHPLLCPLCIISFGICYGRNPDMQMIGDVMIPRKLYPWSIGQKVVEEELQIKHDDFNLSLEDKFSGSNIYSTISQYCDGDEGRIIQKEVNIGSKKHNFKIKVSSGSMSTGEAVVSSKKFKEQITIANRNEKEIGGEMEGYGLAKECIYYAKIPCVIIKSICDWGELKNIEKAFDDNDVKHPENLKDKLQAYAAFCAGIVLLDLFDVEKDRFLNLNIIDWLNKQGICDEYHYASKEEIITAIKNYFSIKCDYEYIFGGLVKLKKLIVVEKEYKTKKVYRTGR